MAGDHGVGRNGTTTTTRTTTTTTTTTNGRVHNSKNEELAALLMESAKIVKLGRRDDPVLHRTMKAFLWYMEEPGEVAKPSMSGMFGKLFGAEAASGKTLEEKSKTSQKNAERAKNDLARDLHAGEENNKPSSSSSSGFFSFPPIPGFTDDGKQTEETAKPQQAADAPKSQSTTAAAANSQQGAAKGETKTAEKSANNRAEFQRPANPKSALIANGWIEQQRRSKMRTVWKDVLASLVEGRKKGEETTLWIQRQVVNPQTNQTELEALHQIPVKWLEEVIYVDFSADNRFSLKVYNLQEEFVFRCPKDADAAKQWVSTLLSAKEGRMKQRSSSMAGGKSSSVKATAAQWEATSNANVAANKKQQQPLKPNPRDRFGRSASANPRKAAATAEQHEFPFDEEKKSNNETAAAPPPSRSASTSPVPPQHSHSSGEHPSPPAAQPEKVHRSIKELRALAHGAGVQTAGMERKELEAVVEQVLASQAAGDADEARRKQQHEEQVRAERERAAAAAAAAEEIRKAEEEKRRQEAEAAAAAEEAERQAAAEKKRQEEVEAAQKATAAAAAESEEHQRRIAERVHQQQMAERRRQQEEERARMEKERLEREEAEHKRRVAEMQEKERQEQIRKQQEEYARQQRAWQEQQAEAERLRRHQQEQEAQAARAREEEARRRQHAAQQAAQWTQASSPPPQQQQQHPHPQAQHPWPGAHHQQQHPHTSPPPHYGQQQHHAYQQQQQQHAAYQQQHRSPPPQQAHAGGSFYGSPPPQQQSHTPPPHPQHTPHAGAPPPQQQQQHQQQQTPQSPINQKYAKMANAADDAAANQKIKHGLLVHWALQPPMLQALKPIEALITTVHKVFPPSFGVAGHDYFKKWKAVQFEDISSGPPQNRVDDDKLNKTVRKLRFFLHPDKLPSDLTSDQSFLIKLLWDITNDAFEEHKKKEEDLGWIRS